MALTDEASGLAVLLAWPGHRQAPVAAGGARRGGGGVEWDREARPLRRRLMGEGPCLSGLPGLRKADDRGWKLFLWLSFEKASLPCALARLGSRVPRYH